MPINGAAFAIKSFRLNCGVRKSFEEQKMSSCFRPTVAEGPSLSLTWRGTDRTTHWHCCYVIVAPLAAWMPCVPDGVFLRTPGVRGRCRRLRRPGYFRIPTRFGPPGCLLGNIGILHFDKSRKGSFTITWNKVASQSVSGSAETHIPEAWKLFPTLVDIQASFTRRPQQERCKKSRERISLFPLQRRRDSWLKLSQSTVTIRRTEKNQNLSVTVFAQFGTDWSPFFPTPTTQPNRKVETEYNVFHQASGICIGAAPFWQKQISPSM